MARWLTISAALGLATLTSLALAQPGHTRTDVPKAIPAQTAQMTAPYLMNVAVTAMYADQCTVAVMLKNLGEDIPDTISQVGYSVKLDATGQELKGTIPASSLKKKGSYGGGVVPGLTLTTAKQSLTAEADGAVRDHRTDHLPTTVTRSLACGDKTSQLIYAVRFDSDCTKTILVRNTGFTFQWPASDHTVTPRFQVARVTDGWPFTPLGSPVALETGQELTLHDDIKTTSTFKSGLLVGLGLAVAKDPIEAPARCKGTPPNRKVEIVSVGLNATCHPQVTLKNVGVPLEPGALVSAQINSAIASTDVGNIGFATNATVTVTGSIAIPNKATNVDVAVDNPSGVVRKTVSLKCPH